MDANGNHQPEHPEKPKAKRSLYEIRRRLAKQESHLLTYLGASALVLLFAVIFYSYIIPQTPGRMARASVALIPDLRLWSLISPINFLQSSSSVAIWLVLVAIVAFAAYSFAAFVLWRRQATKWSKRVVFGTTVTIYLASVFALPNLNTDIFHYITRARVAAVHGSNPHYVPSDAFPDDPIYLYASKRYTGLVGDKLAFWTLMSIGLAKIDGDSAVGNLLVFRFAFFLFNLGNVVLLALILKKLSPRYMLAGVVLFAWNPIVMVLGQSKTDTAMVFFLLAGILLLVYDRSLLAMFMMTLSVLVKAMTLPIICLYLMRAVRLRKWRELIGAIAVIGLTTWAVNAPFWQGSELLTSNFHMIVGQSALWFPQWLRMTVLAAVFILAFGLGLAQNKNFDRLLLSWSLVLLCVSLFFVRVSYSWYLITLVALISVTLNWQLVVISISLTFSAFLFNTWYSTFTQSFNIPDLFVFPRMVVYLLPVFLSGFLLLVMSLLKNRKPVPTDRVAVLEGSVG